MRSLFFLPAVEYGTHCRLREREGGKEREEGRMRRGEEGRHRIMGTHTPEHVCLASCGGPEVSARRTMAHRSVAWPCATRAIRVCLVSSIIARRNRIRRMCIGRKPRRVFSSLSPLFRYSRSSVFIFLSFVGASGETGDHHLRRIYFSFLDPRSRGRGRNDATDAYVRKISLKHAARFRRVDERADYARHARRFVTRMTPASRYPIVSARTIDKSYVGD